MSVRGPLRVEIGVLSLSGVSGARATHIGSAFQAELAKLLATDSAHRSLHAAAKTGLSTVVSLDAGSLVVPRRESAARTGRRLAQHIVGHLPGLRR